MKLSTVFSAAALFLCSHMVSAATAGGYTSFNMGTVQCTQINPDHLVLSCKLSDPATGGESELASSLINYDVKNSEGKVIASGYGNNVTLDHTKLTMGEEYSIIVYAVVNGSVESQTITRHAGDTK
jgi:hypothetical protein